MGVTKWCLFLLVSVWLGGCKGANDTVLQPDSVAGSGGTSEAGRGASGGAGSAGSTSGGTAGKPPAAGSGTTGTAGAAGTVSTAAGASGAAGKAGAAGVTPVSGTSGSAAGSGVAAAAGSEGGTGAAGEAGGAGSAGASGEGGMAGAAADPECDFTGIWAAKQVTVSEALSLPQSSNNWYYLEFKQSGTNVEVSRHFDCGIEVAGSATVTVSRKTLESLIPHNVQVGRKATLVKNGATCKFEGARFWSIRGADEQQFLPNATRDSSDSIEQVEQAKPLPESAMTEGAVDTESDGKLGVAFQVSGIVTGTRNSVQRDWTQWFTEPGYEIPASTNWTTDLKIRADFDNQENVLAASNDLLRSGSTPRGGAKHILRLRFLGRDASDPRVSTIVKGTDVDTCFAIQDAFPAEQLE